MFNEPGSPTAESAREFFYCYDISGTPDGKKVYAAGEGGRIYIHEPQQDRSAPGR